MTAFRIFSSFMLCVSFISFSYGQFEGPIEIQRAYDTTIDLSVYQQTFAFSANDDEMIALYNVSINFENGECLNPLVRIEFERIDSDGSDEELYIFYDSFNNDSQIARCNTASTWCGRHTFCTEFEPPSGTYAELIFFIGTESATETLCTDPPRTVQGRFNVSCQIDIESLCPIQTTMVQQDDDDDESSSESSSESRENAVQEFGHKLTEQHDLENDSKHNDANNEVVTFRFDGDTSNNFLIMFVVGLCFCCVVECGFIYALYNKK